MRYVDLHIHTTASDGKWEIEKALKVAEELGLVAVSFTDHDTVEGTVEAQKFKNDYKVDIIPGIEFSTYYEEDIHVLGYFIDVENSKLLREAEKQRLTRRRRAEKTLEKLEEYDIYITMGRLKEIAGGDSISRTHICTAIIEELGEEHDKKTFDRIYDEYLAESAKTYVKRDKIITLEVIETILDAGGIPVLAHPGKIKNQELIPQIINKGLLGVEAYYACGSKGKYSDSDEEITKQFLDIARENNLLVTGGSDSHGPASPRPVEIGCARVPSVVYEDLRNYRKKNL